MIGIQRLQISNSLNNFIDTNVLIRHANNDSSPDCRDLKRIFEEGCSGSRKLWVSSVLFAELRPSHFTPGSFKSVDQFAEYIEGIAEVISPNPETMLRAARLRDQIWERANKHQNEKRKCMTLGDAIHIASTLFVKEAQEIKDLEFLTFDNGKSRTAYSTELDKDTHALPILDLHNYTYGIGSHPDVIAATSLARAKPILASPQLDI